MRVPYRKFEPEPAPQQAVESEAGHELAEVEQRRLEVAKQFAARMAEKLQIKIEKGGHTLVPALGEGVLVTRAVTGTHEISGETLNSYERVVDVLNAVASATMWTCLLLGKYDKAAMAKAAVFSLTWVEPALKAAVQYAKEKGDELAVVLQRIADSTPLVRNMENLFADDELELLEE